MELFDVLPERFFGLQAGKCRRIYAEAGLCLYEQYRLAQFGIEQEILRDKFQELIESWADAGIAYEDEDFSGKDTDNNIKKKMEQVSAQMSLQEVLSHHFVEYRADIVDRSYHRLKTSNHVSHYRIRILQEVQEIRQNKVRFRVLCEDACAVSLPTQWRRQNTA